MRVDRREFCVDNLYYTIRSAAETDAKDLSEVRLRIDGETENLDRDPGEAYIDEPGFEQLIRDDAQSDHNLFLVADVDGHIAGFSRCEGTSFKRFAHKVEFGVCVLQEYWGYGIGKNLLQESIRWADANAIKKMTLAVLETNEKAIKLYQRYGFEVEGILRNDRQLSDGNYYNTIVMGRWNG